MKRMLFICFKMMILVMMWIGVSWLMQNTSYGKIDYQINDVPHEKFRVLLEKDGFRQPETWQNAQKMPPDLWANTPDLPNDCRQNCLQMGADNTLIYHTEQPLMMYDSAYRIENNRLVPVWFRVLSFLDFLLVMITAMLLYYLGKYAIGAWQNRHSREKWHTYHRAVFRKIIKTLIFVAIFLALIYGLSVSKAA